MNRSQLNVLRESPAMHPTPAPAGELAEVVLAAPGVLEVALADGQRLACLVLETVLSALQVGDRVLVMRVDDAAVGAVVLGRVMPAGELPRQLQLRAAESVSLGCGEAAIELRANGQALIKGEDVTVHAKGTQRIRAGTVAIN